jgi:hypothetical protein
VLITDIDGEELWMLNKRLRTEKTLIFTEIAFITVFARQPMQKRQAIKKDLAPP